MDSWEKTGRKRYVTRFIGRVFRKEVIILQIEERGILVTCSGGYVDSEHVNRWRDATTKDISVFECP